MSAEQDMQKLAILDKMLASNESIRAVVANARKHASSAKDDKTRERRAANFIIAHYANRCGITGGLSGIPGFIPVIGGIYSTFGASTVDAVAALKFEIEMSLALSDLCGFDIDDANERKVAIIMACAALKEEIDDDDDASLFDIVEAACSEYSTRQLSKTLVRLFSRAVMSVAAKRWTRFFPVVGMAIGLIMNAGLSTRTGLECYHTLLRRKKRQSEV